jgi:hypothetical protein
VEQAAQKVRIHMTALRSLPPAWLIWLPLLALLPGRRGWRASVACAGVLTFTVLQVAIPAWLTHFGARYAYFFMGPAIMLVAVAPFRLVSTVARHRPAWLSIATTAVSMGVVLAAWAPRPASTYLQFDEDRAIQELDSYLQDRLGPDDQLLECAVLGAETHWYPRRLHPDDLNPYGADWEMCRAWVAAPDAPGEHRWLVSVDRLTDAPPEAPGPPFSSSIPDPAGQGWLEMHRFRLEPHLPEVIIWRRPGQEAP